MPSLRNPQQAVISNSATGQTTLISNPSTTGYMYVWDIYVSVATSTNLVFFDGKGAITGNINLLAGGQFNPAAAAGVPIFVISPNSNLSVTSTASAQQSGWLTYSN